MRKYCINSEAIKFFLHHHQGFVMDKCTFFFFKFTLKNFYNHHFWVTEVIETFKHFEKPLS